MDVVTITGPSFSGKSTLVEKMIFEGSRFARVITCTTRPPREGERHGVDYYFLTNKEYDQALAEERFVDTTPGSGGNRYGVLRDELERIASLGKIGLIACDPKGPQNIRQYASRHPEVNHIAVFLDIDCLLAAYRMQKALHKAVTGQDKLSGLKIRLGRLLSQNDVNRAIFLAESLQDSIQNESHKRAELLDVSLNHFLQTAFKTAAVDSVDNASNGLHLDEHSWKKQFLYDKAYDSGEVERFQETTIDEISHLIDKARVL